MIKAGRVNISVFTVIGVLCVFAVDFSIFTLLAVVAMALHEAMHLLLLKHFGVKIEKINVYPFGIDILADMRRLSYKAELLCVLAGCMANLFAGCVCCVILKVYPSKELLFFAFSNFVFGVGNLVPLPCFDGGRAVKLVVESLFLPDTAYSVWRAFSFLSPILFFLFSMVIIFFSKCNFSIVIGVAYAALCSIILEKREKTT